MPFSDWIGLADVHSSVPPENGIFQIKVQDELLTYPTGRSAMLFYGNAQNLNQELINFRKKILPLLEISEEALLVRWMPTSEYEAGLQSQLHAFFINFGGVPFGNQMLLNNQIQSSHFY